LLVIFDMRGDLFNKLLHKDINYYDVNKSGELISRLTSDIGVVQSAASDDISMFLRSLVQFLGSLIFLWFISWKLTLFILIVTPIYSLFKLLFVRSMKKYKKLYQDSLAKANSLANEVFGNIRMVKSFATEVK
jgi:ABC-type multidrug transport system fused ATPase/permease subunit